MDITDLVGEDGAEHEEGNGEEGDEENGEMETKIIERKPTKREKLDKKRKIEEYLDEHLPFNVFPLTLLF